MFEIALKQKKRIILHIDADAFFASVEQALNPELKGKAVLVGGHSDTHGIVSTASYEAKRLGVYSGMPIYQAKKICPHAVIVPGHFSAYREFSGKMFEIFNEFTPDVEMTSIDEAYLDITECLSFLKMTPEEAARAILFKIHDSLDISASCGLASNKTVAKIASSLNKPHKLTIVPFASERNFLSPLSLKAMPGIGPKTFKVLSSFGLETLGDLNSMSLQKLINTFGLNIIPLWKRANGVDNRVVDSSHSLPKSISNERTLYKPVTDLDFHMRVFRELSNKVFYRLRKHGMRAKTVSVKIKYKLEEAGKPYFKYYSAQKSLDRGSAIDSELFPVAKALFMENYSNENPIRLIGIGVSNLKKNYNLSLFNENDKKLKLFEAVDKVKEHYGVNFMNYGI